MIQAVLLEVGPPQDLELIKTIGRSRKRSQKVNIKLYWDEFCFVLFRSLRYFFLSHSLFRSFVSIVSQLIHYSLSYFLFFLFRSLDYFLFYSYFKSHIVPFPCLTPLSLLPALFYFHCKLYFPHAMLCSYSFLLLFLLPLSSQNHSSFL